MTTFVRLPAPLHVDVAPAAGRTTAPPLDRAFRDLLGEGASALLAGVDAASDLVPGGALVSAAVSGFAGAAGPTSPGNPFDATLGRAAESQLELLTLQARMQEENQRFTTLSNVLRAEHETAKTAIGNLR